MLRQNPARVLRDFRDSLQVRGMLQHEERKLIQNYGDIRLLNYENCRRNRWQMFLDDLCLLCNNHRGGCITTSIATEQRLCKVVFWLTMNEGDLGRAKRWLKGILDVVQRGVGARPDLTSSLVHDLFVRSVRRSSQRVTNYANRLSSVLEDSEGKADLTTECELQVEILSSSFTLSWHQGLTSRLHPSASCDFARTTSLCAKWPMRTARLPWLDNTRISATIPKSTTKHTEHVITLDG